MKGPFWWTRQRSITYLYESEHLEMRGFVVFILFLLFTPAVTIVHAGPPLLTDDTGTPEVGHWEI